CFAEQQRQAHNANINFILSPEGEVAKGGIRRVQLVRSKPSAPVRKDAEFKLPRGELRRQDLHPPGPPCGIPPALSDIEGEGDDPYHVPIPADDDLVPVIIPDFDGPSKFPKFPSVLPLRQPAHPPPLGPVLSRITPVDIPVLPLPTTSDPSAAISPAPVNRCDREAPVIGPEASTVDSGAPQLRNLRKETLK
ncbi:unnamed protein product, partial [Cylicostephanus goldi]